MSDLEEYIRAGNPIKNVLDRSTGPDFVFQSMENTAPGFVVLVQASGYEVMGITTYEAFRVLRVPGLR